MSNPDIDEVALTDYNLIDEEVFDQSVFRIIAPRTKLGGIKIPQPGHRGQSIWWSTAPD